MVNRAVDAGGSVDAAMEMASAIADNGPPRVRAALSVVRTTPDLNEAAALERELEAAAQLMATGEVGHGVSAFVSRTKPEFPDP